METIVEQLIADFHERDLPAFTRRHVRLPWLPRKIDTVIGMRRSGKTWFLFQTISDLLSTKIPKKSILYLNLEDERLLPMAASDLHRIPEVYYRRYPHLRDRSCMFFFRRDSEHTRLGTLYSTAARYRKHSYLPDRILSQTVKPGDRNEFERTNYLH